MFAGIMLYNWVHIKYPREKLEWLILDDTPGTPEYNLCDYLPTDDPLIRYVKLDKEYKVADKRNLAVSMAKYDFVSHMDDDDLIFPDSVLAKIRLILHYNMEGVHSMPIGIYDMMEKTSIIFSTKVDCNDIAEASITYRKRYWQTHRFESDEPNGTSEGRAFIGKNFHKWMKVHFLFNMVSITHTQNVTGHGRRFINDTTLLATGNFEDVFPEDFKVILENLRKMLAKDYKRPE